MRPWMSVEMLACGIVVLMILHVDSYRLQTTATELHNFLSSRPNIVQVGGPDNLKSDLLETRRRRRAVDVYREPQRKTLRILVVLDDSVIDFHGRAKVVLYVHSMMSVVDQVFHHPSLGHEIKVVPVAIHLMNATIFNRIWKTEKSSSILKQFCKWTNELKKSLYVNASIGMNVYLTRRHFGPAGYAPVHGVCQELRNCAIIKDTGVSSAFVFAHEIGHNLGINHDGDGNACSADMRDGRIMGPRVVSHFFEYYWTSCSREYLEKYIQFASCLDDEHGTLSAVKYKDSYGQRWSLDDQCRQEFGEYHAFCPHVSVEYSCRLLSCHNKNRSSGACTTKNSPPMQGTSCGPRKWCVDGYCVEKTNVSVDGGWSLWEERTPCSRSCGSGFKFRERKCNNPSPSEFSKPCRGPTEEFLICNREPCPHVSDFRAEQCEAHNNRTFPQRMRHHWVPYDVDRSLHQCELHCISMETGDTLTGKLIDGTFCSYDDPYGRCFKGSCKPLGCDGVVYSEKKDDQCGLCDGNGKLCKKIKGHFDDTLPMREYHHLLTLPANARNIIIREKHSKPHLAHFFALRDSTSEEWILNGGTNLGRSRKFISNGARFSYYNGFAEGESLVARGPLLSPLDFLVYSMSSRIPAWVEYKYTIPLNDTQGFIATKEALQNKSLHDASGNDGYVWKSVAWSNCSKSCDTGYQHEILECVKKETGSVEDGFCSQRKKKPSKKICNAHPCTTRYWWYSEEWDQSSCMVACGIEGTQRRLIQCMTHRNGENVKVSPHYCDQRTMPISARRCAVIPCSTPVADTNGIDAEADGSGESDRNLGNSRNVGDDFKTDQSRRAKKILKSDKKLKIVNDLNEIIDEHLIPVILDGVVFSESEGKV